MGDDRGAAVVYNPVKVDVDALRALVQAEESRLGRPPSSWHETLDEDSGRLAVQEALAGAPAVLLVAGGDGTVRVAAELAQGTGTPVALIPSGTGNLLARNLGLPLNDMAESVRVAFAGSTRAVDVAVAQLQDAGGARSRHVFLVMAGIGLDADMAQNTSAAAKRRIGWLAYIAPIARSIVDNRQFRLRYRIDAGRPQWARTHTVIAGNCGTLTGNMLLLPEAAVDDGLLDVVMLRPKTRFGWTRIGTRLAIQALVQRWRLGRRVLQLAPELDALSYVQGRSFELRLRSPRGIQLDGDGFGEIVAARIAVRPAALRVCTAAA